MPLKRQIPSLECVAITWFHTIFPWSSLFMFQLSRNICSPLIVTALLPINGLLLTPYNLTATAASSLNMKVTKYLRVNKSSSFWSLCIILYCSPFLAFWGILQLVGCEKTWSSLSPCWQCLFHRLNLKNVIPQILILISH